MYELNRIEDLRVTRRVKRMVALSSAGATDSLAVIGRRSLEHLVALLSLGFERAACVTDDGLAVCSEPIEHLFICGPLTDAHLERVIASMGRGFRHDGTIVAQLREASQDRVISQTLRRRGLFESPPRFKDVGDVLAAHRLRRPDSLLAAA